MNEKRIAELEAELKQLREAGFRLVIAGGFIVVDGNTATCTQCKESSETESIPHKDNCIIRPFDIWAELPEDEREDYWLTLNPEFITFVYKIVEMVEDTGFPDFMDNVRGTTSLSRDIAETEPE